MVSIEVQLFGWKLKFRKFFGLIPTFLQATEVKLAGGVAFFPPPPHPEYIKKKIFSRNIVSEKITCRKTSPGKLPNGAQPPMVNRNESLPHEKLYFAIFWSGWSYQEKTIELKARG